MMRNKKYFLQVLPLILFFNKTPSLFAEDLINCRGAKTTATSIEELAQVALHLDWWSASPELIQKKKCKKNIPTLKEIKAEFEKKQVLSDKINHKVKNIEFENESSEFIEAFTRLTTKRDIYGKAMPAPDLQEAYKINPECKKVECAVEKIFGKELGNKILFLNLKYGFNASELAFTSSSRLNLKEIDSLIAATEAYPASRFPIDKNKQLTKFKRGYRIAEHDENVLAYAAITFYDRWSNQTESMREYVAFHEMGHYVASELKIDSNPAWLALSGWVEKGDHWEKTHPNATSSKYGSKNPAEDFAESLAAYRYNPELLKSINAEKYQFIKEAVFDGLEYTSANKCSEKNSITFKIQNDFANTSLKRSPTEIKESIEKCGTESKNYILSPKIMEGPFLKCLKNNQEIAKALLNFEKIKSTLKYPDFVKNSLQKTQLQNFSDIKSNSDLRGEFQDIKTYIQDEITKNMLNWDRENYFNYNTKKAAELCQKTWDQYSWQALFKEDKKLSKALNAYSSSLEFQNIFQQLCLEIQQNKTAPKPFEQNEVEKSLTRYFSPQ